MGIATRAHAIVRFFIFLLLLSEPDRDWLVQLCD
jgi:hypothetical protein